MKKILKFTIVMSILFVGCGNNTKKTTDIPKPISQENVNNTDKNNTDGNNTTQEPIKGGELLIDFSGKKIKASLLLDGAIDENTTVYGYKAYKIPYTTKDETGHEVKASGLFVIPTGLPNIVKNTLGISMVSDDHGTIVSHRSAPTAVAKDTGIPQGTAVLITSIGGFATLKPDYIGFGDAKEHHHPYVQKDSLANATIDFIRQVKVFAKENNINLNQQLFLTGYSEGGYAAMATIKKIEEEQLTDLKVTMVAPMAGPYDLITTINSVLTRESWRYPSLMADFGYSYAKLKNKDLDIVFNKPYDSTIPKLFDGSLGFSGVNKGLTNTVKGKDGLFKDSFVSNYFNIQDDWFREALIENSVHEWSPKTPIRLIQCEGDDIIPYEVTTITEAKMKELGAVDVVAIPVEKTLGLGKKLRHISCAGASYKLTTKIFADIRKKTIGY